MSSQPPLRATRARGLLLLLALALYALGASAQGAPDHGPGRLLVTIVDPQHDTRVALPGETGAYAVRRGYAPSGWVLRQLRKVTRDHQLELVDGWQMASLGVYCALVQIKADPPGRTRQEVLDALRADDRVETAQPLNAFSVRQDPTPEPSDPYAPLQDAHAAMDVAKAHRWATGKGVRVAVIDTGVDARHRDLRKRISESRNFVPGDEAVEVHGTAVAGVIGATAGNGLGGHGVAPDVSLYAYRACWVEAGSSKKGRCDSFTLARALDRAIDKRVDVVNLSLAGPADALLSRLVAKALAQGIVVVGPLVDNARAPFPATVKGVIAVSDRPAAQGVFAPDSDVLTTIPADAFDFMNGVSFATAHVSGIVALLRQLRPDATPARVYEALRSSTDGSGEPLVVNACRALDSLADTRCAL